jgi:hypothetical protein
LNSNSIYRWVKFKILSFFLKKIWTSNGQK